MKISEHFTTEEFEKSRTANKEGIDNRIKSDIILNNIKNLCENILEPIRAEFGPVHISSGYRSIALNRKVDSQDSSQHILGQAADIMVKGVDVAIVADFINNYTNFDQVIEEHHKNSSWVHVSFNNPNDNRKHAMKTVNINGKIVGYKTVKTFLSA